MGSRALPQIGPDAFRVETPSGVGTIGDALLDDDTVKLLVYLEDGRTTLATWAQCRPLYENESEVA